MENDIKASQKKQTQFFLVLLHEYEYEKDMPASWMTHRRETGRVTALCAYERAEGMQWDVVSYNGWNSELTTVP